VFEAPDIPGVENVIAWFGHWPTFHDAEVVSINLDRGRGCRVVVKAFRKTSTVDEQGRYVCDKQAVVTFLLEGFPLDSAGIVNSRIECFNHQNVLSSLQVNRIPDGCELVLEGIFGVDGRLVASHMTVELRPA
jgi:hypothetical protein